MDCDTMARRANQVPCAKWCQVRSKCFIPVIAGDSEASQHPCHRVMPALVAGIHVSRHI
jgi:hypothetical protein